MNYELKLLSKYRTQLMGLAMLFILIFHTGIDVSNINILRSLKDIGDVGVDMFLLLSGIGLYFSYSTDYNKTNFYKKRVLRILPTFIPIAIIWYCANKVAFGMSLSDVFLGITTLSFWIKGNVTWWFISAILILYLLTPIYIDLMNKKYKTVSLATVLIFIVIGLSIRFTFLDEYFDYLLIFVCRIPTFLIGILVGKIIKEGHEMKINMILVYVSTFISLIISVLVVNPDYIYIPFALKYYVYAILSFGICIILSKVFSKHENKKYMLLTFLGTYSLEMYLLHEKILWILSFSEKFIVIDKYHIVLNIVAILIAMLLSLIWHKIVSKCLTMTSDKKLKEVAITQD